MSRIDEKFIPAVIEMAINVSEGRLSSLSFQDSLMAMIGEDKNLGAAADLASVRYTLIAALRRSMDRTEGPDCGPAPPGYYDKMTTPGLADALRQDRDAFRAARDAARSGADEPNAVQERTALRVKLQRALAAQKASASHSLEHLVDALILDRKRWIDRAETLMQDRDYWFEKTRAAKDASTAEPSSLPELERLLRSAIDHDDIPDAEMPSEGVGLVDLVQILIRERDASRSQHLADLCAVRSALSLVERGPVSEQG